MIGNKLSILAALVSIYICKNRKKNLLCLLICYSFIITVRGVQLGDTVPVIGTISNHEF